MLRLDFPQVKRFNRAATMHLEAARLLLESCDQKASTVLATEVMYLSGYVVECVLKAVLLSNIPKSKHGAMIERFKTEIKHNLEKLKDAVAKKKIEMPRDKKEAFRRVCGVWSSEMRYDAVNRLRENAELVAQAAGEVFRWANPG